MNCIIPVIYCEGREMSHCYKSVEISVGQVLKYRWLSIASENPAPLAQNRGTKGLFSLFFYLNVPMWTGTQSQWVNEGFAWRSERSQSSDWWDTRGWGAFASDTESSSRLCPTSQEPELLSLPRTASETHICLLSSHLSHPEKLKVPLFIMRFKGEISLGFNAGTPCRDWKCNERSDKAS